MEIHVDRNEDEETLTLSGRGEIDYATMGTLSQALDDALEDDLHAVVVDLQEVTYMDSLGLGVLVNAHKRLTASGRSLILRIAHPELIKLLRITGLDQLFAIEMPYGEGTPAPPA
jgi:anti-sigma B factor antagonist